MFCDKLRRLLASLWTLVICSQIVS